MLWALSFINPGPWREAQISEQGPASAERQGSMGEDGVRSIRRRQPSLRDRLTVATMQELPYLTTERLTPLGSEEGAYEVR